MDRTTLLLSGPFGLDIDLVQSFVRIVSLRFPQLDFGFQQWHVGLLFGCHERSLSRAAILRHRDIKIALRNLIFTAEGRVLIPEQHVTLRDLCIG
ncbi:MAG: hypothetical protein NDI90_00955 [Nitrospira sp. BO4]|nr:hypothetical protein [Nitrospira sp. BO4]